MFGLRVFRSSVTVGFQHFRRQLLSTGVVCRSPSWGPPPPAVDRKDIEFRVLQCLLRNEKIDKNKLTPNCDLMTELGLDSLDLIECLVELEDEFNLDLNSIQNQNINVCRLVDHVTTQLTNRNTEESRRPDVVFKPGFSAEHPMP